MEKTKKLSRSARKKEKQDQAKWRQEAYSKLANKEKIEMLDKELGKGVGAKKQREKLTTK